MQHHATMLKQRHGKGSLGFDPVQIAGTEYFPLNAVLRALGISRQTLWRWGRDGKVPAGHRYRGHQLLFTAQEFEAVREYAQRVEPVEGGNGAQLKLFNGARGVGA